MDSTTTRFRFRDQGMDDSTESDISEDDSLSPEPRDDESELKSMTGKVIFFTKKVSQLGFYHVKLLSICYFSLIDPCVVWVAP